METAAWQNSRDVRIVDWRLEKVGAVGCRYVLHEKQGLLYRTRSRGRLRPRIGGLTIYEAVHGSMAAWQPAAHATDLVGLFERVFR